MKQKVSRAGVGNMNSNVRPKVYLTKEGNNWTIETPFGKVLDINKKPIEYKSSELKEARGMVKQLRKEY